jgi:uncharacterized protein
MKKIGIISDTHGELPGDLFKKFHGVDLILHAGDIGNHYILTELETIATVYAVYGNMDEYDLRSSVSVEINTEIEGFIINLSHRKGIHFEDGADIYVRGHTHVLDIRWVENKLLLNPGSAIAKRSRGSSYGTALLLELEKGKKPNVTEVIWEK